MKKDIFIKRYSILLLSILTLSIASCSDSDEKVEHYIEVSESAVEANKFGTTDKGEKILIDVSSTIYWKLSMGDASEWLSTNTLGGYSSTELIITVAPNAGTTRNGIIKLEAIDGTTASITVNQRGAEEKITYITEAFDERAEEKMTVVEYDEVVGWTPTGISATGLRFGGVGSFVTNTDASKGYDKASGGNNIHLVEAKSNLSFGAVELHGKKAFTITFGSKSSATIFDKKNLKLYTSLDNIYWSEIAYERGTGAEWALATSKFYFTEEISKLYFKIESEVANTFRIDDLSLLENEATEGEKVNFAVYIDDGKPVGHVYYETDFSWSISGDEWIPNQVGTKEVGFTAVKDEAQKLLLEQSGWKIRESVTFAYLRPGYIKLGKTKLGGHVISPKLVMKEGSVVNGKLTVDAAIYASAGGTKDLDGIVIELVNAGTIGDIVTTTVTLDVNSWNAWAPIELNLYGITSETQIAFRGKIMSSTDKSNRFFIDNLKIVKRAK